MVNQPDLILLGEEEAAQNILMSVLIAEKPEEMESEMATLIKFLEREALELLERKNVAAAKKISEQILEIEPNYYNPNLDFKTKISHWYQKIPELANSGQFQSAIEILTMILQADENFASAWNALGVMYYNIQQNGLALEAINKAINLSQSDPLVWFNLGLILESIGKIDKAINAYKNAIKLDNKMLVAYLNLGNIFENLGELEEAKSIYHQ